MHRFCCYESYRHLNENTRMNCDSEVPKLSKSNASLKEMQSDGGLGLQSFPNFGGLDHQKL